MQPLFESTTTYDFETYKQFAKFVSNKINKFNNRLIVIDICLLLLAALCSRTGSASMRLAFIISCFTVPVLLVLRRSRQMKKAWNSNKMFQNAEYHYAFYEDKMEISASNGQMTAEYDKIHKVLEDNTCFFVMVSVNSGYMVKKDTCSPELIQFIKNIKK